MNVFIIGSPLETAMCLDKRRFNKQIAEVKGLLTAIQAIKDFRSGTITKEEFKKVGYTHHPATLQMFNHTQWLRFYNATLLAYKDYDYELIDMMNEEALKLTPSFFNQEFFNQHKRRLYTKDPVHYAQFAEYGTSEDNWYFVDGEMRIYRNGKRIKQ